MNSVNSQHFSGIHKYHYPRKVGVAHNYVKVCCILRTSSPWSPTRWLHQLKANTTWWLHQVTVFPALCVWMLLAIHGNTPSVGRCFARNVSRSMERINHVLTAGGKNHSISRMQKVSFVCVHVQMEYVPHSTSLKLSSLPPYPHRRSSSLKLSWL